MRILLSLLFGFFPFITSQADDQRALARYFRECLQGRTGMSEPRQRIKQKELTKTRHNVWNIWRRVQAETGSLLPAAFDSLAHPCQGKLTLPDSLEPHAVMPYYTGVKGSKPSAGYPLFLYLHGSGPKAAEWQAGLQLAQRFDDAPSAYLIPQIPQEGSWYRWWQRSKQWAWERLLRELLVREDIDPLRLYLFGISEGGYGSQRLASFYADYFAAAGPMAGGEPLRNAPAENLRHLPFSLLTGADDRGFFRNLLTARVAASLDSLRRLFPDDFTHRVTLIPHRGHAIDYRPTTPWLSTFRRTPRPHNFSWEDFEMDGRRRKGFYNLVIEEQPATGQRVRYDFDVHDNVVTLTAREVHYTTTERDSTTGIELAFRRTYTPVTAGRVTLFLDETMIDLGRPVTVVVNDRPAFVGKLRPDLAHMARSVATFYDPERIFPAAVTVSL